MTKWVVPVACLVLAGCATTSDYHYREPAYEARLQAGTVLTSWVYSPDMAERALTLDPEALTAEDVKEVLSNFPAPRIINLSSSFQYRSMESFSRFLIAMGYPEGKIRSPRDGNLAYPSFRSSRNLAGALAWYYEKEGMMPVLIGHSQGGMMAVKVLHELSGSFDRRPIEVWNPLTERGEGRIRILDPLKRGELTVRDLRLGYAASAVTGRTMRVLLGQWDMFRRLRTIPDTVRDFTGFEIQGDWLGAHDVVHNESDRYHAIGMLAQVRSVYLHGDFSRHFKLPSTEHLASDEAARRWIERYVPENVERPTDSEIIRTHWNILFAAETWHGIKKHWCLSVQDMIRAKRAFYEG